MCLPRYRPCAYEALAFLNQKKQIVLINLVYVTIAGNTITRRAEHGKRYSWYAIRLAQRLMNETPYFVAERHRDGVTVITFFHSSHSKQEYLKHKPKTSKIGTKTWNRKMGLLFGYPEFAIRDFESREYKNNPLSRIFILIKPLGLFFGILKSSAGELQTFIDKHNIKNKDVLVYSPSYSSYGMFSGIKRFNRKAFR